MEEPTTVLDLSEQPESSSKHETGRQKIRFICDRCGDRMRDDRCKIVCDNCGNRFDCSDLNLYFG